jgi:hypothetical protein
MVESPGQKRFAVHIVKALKKEGADVPKELEDLADYLFQIAKSGAEKYSDVGSGDVAFDRNAVPHMCRSLDLKAQNIMERLLAMALFGRTEAGDPRSPSLFNVRHDMRSHVAIEVSSLICWRWPRRLGSRTAAMCRSGI